MSYKPTPQTMMLLEQAGEFFQAKRFLQAQLICNDILGKYPNDVNALHMAALVASSLEEYEKALALFEKTTQLAPDFMKAFFNWGNLCHKIGLLKKSERYLKKAIELDANFLPSYKLLGDVYYKMNQFDDSTAIYEQALNIKPDAEISWRVGKNYAISGNIEKAIALYRNALEIDPNNTSAYFALARISSVNFTSHEIKEMEHLLETKLNDSDQISLGFALSKAYEDTNEHEKSFATLQKASSIKRKTIKYDANNTKLLTTRLIDTFDEAFFASRNAYGHDDNSPIFIVSMPRAGSSLTEQILSSHSQVFGAGELSNIITVAQASIALTNNGRDFIERLPHFTQEDSQKMGSLYLQLSEKWRFEKTPFFTDKLPTNFHLLGFMHLILPNAKIIHVYRDPIDTCFGCFKMNFAGDLDFSYDLAELGSYYCEYWRLMTHWNNVLPNKIYNLKYETLVHDQEGETRRLLNFCGLDWEEQCLSFYKTDRTVKTASAEQVRRPISKERIGLWKPYEQHLQPLIQALQPLLQANNLMNNGAK